MIGRSAIKRLLTFLATIALVPLAHAQQRSTGPTGAYTLRVDAREVVLNATVLDSHGELVNGLASKNFAVREDGTPQTILSVQHQDTPVSIGLLVDDSGSMSSKREAVTAAALNLVKASNPEDETFIINFSDQAYLDQGFTSDLDALKRALDHQSVSGGTALYDTVATGSDLITKSGTRPRRALIVITDGDDDNTSKMKLSDAVRHVQYLNGPTAYCIGLRFGRGQSHSLTHDLEELSNQTGGRAFFASSLEEIDKVTAEIARDIRNQYAIAYRSSHDLQNVSYHRVQVEARGSGGAKLRIQVRPGYFSRHSGSNRASLPSAFDRIIPTWYGP